MFDQCHAARAEDHGAKRAEARRLINALSYMTRIMAPKGTKRALAAKTTLAFPPIKVRFVRSNGSSAAEAAAAEANAQQNWGVGTGGEIQKLCVKA